MTRQGEMPDQKMRRTGAAPVPYRRRMRRETRAGAVKEARLRRRMGHLHPRLRPLQRMHHREVVGSLERKEDGADRRVRLRRFNHGVELIRSGRGRRGAAAGMVPVDRSQPRARPRRREVVELFPDNKLPARMPPLWLPPPY